MKRLVLILMAVLFATGGWPPGAEALELELHGGGKMSSLNEAPGEHLVVLGAMLSHVTRKDIEFYAHGIGEFDNQMIKHGKADGTDLEIGFVVPLDERSDLRVWVSDKEPRISIDDESVEFRVNYRFGEK